MPKKMRKYLGFQLDKYVSRLQSRLQSNVSVAAAATQTGNTIHSHGNRYNFRQPVPELKSNLKLFEGKLSRVNIVTKTVAVCSSATSSSSDAKVNVTKAAFVKHNRGHFTEHYELYYGKGKHRQSSTTSINETFIRKLIEEEDEGIGLGSGNYGAVFKVRHKSSGALRACKVMPKKGLSLDGDRSRVANSLAVFREELEHLKSVDHPNIVKVYESFEDADNFYMIMELMMGGELFSKILEQGALREDIAQSYTKQIMSSLNYLHRVAGIMHRDLKPENFLLSSDHRTVKMIDFGHGTKIKTAPHHRESFIGGTVFYVAPEVLEGDYCEACDIWSAGTIIYTMLCGYPPFSGRNDEHTLKLVKRGKLEFPHPDELTHIYESNNKFSGMEGCFSDSAKSFMKMLIEKDERLRPTALVCLKHEWLRFSSDENAIDFKPSNLRRNYVMKEEDIEARKTQLLYSLKKWYSLRQFQRLVLHAIAAQLADEIETRPLKEMFDALDTDGNGALSLSEVTEAIRSVDPYSNDAHRIFRSVDADESGSIEFTEFVAAMVSVRKFSRLLYAAFRLFDQDCDGKINDGDLLNVLNLKDSSRLMLQGMIAEFDVDGDGCIDFEEFKAMMKSLEK